mgnify:CR=1 FL=1
MFRHCQGLLHFPKKQDTCWSEHMNASVSSCELTVQHNFLQDWEDAQWQQKPNYAAWKFLSLWEILDLKTRNVRSQPRQIHCSFDLSCAWTFTIRMDHQLPRQSWWQTKQERIKLFEKWKIDQQWGAEKPQRWETLTSKTMKCRQGTKVAAEQNWFEFEHNSQRLLTDAVDDANGVWVVGMIGSGAGWDHGLVMTSSAARFNSLSCGFQWLQEHLRSSRIGTCVCPCMRWKMSKP